MRCGGDWLKTPASGLVRGPAHAEAKVRKNAPPRRNDCLPAMQKEAHSPESLARLVSKQVRGQGRMG